jgi:predicted alpha-1,6-mannanase (GH76 family)
MADLTVPDRFGEWPHDARRFVLAEANTAAEIRAEIDSVVGLDSTSWEDQTALSLTKGEAAAILLALKGPELEP